MEIPYNGVIGEKMTNYTEKDLKFMKLAALFGEEFCTCLSPRKIGTVIVRNGQVIGEGVNGPPRGVLHIEDSYIKIDENTAVFGRGWFYSECKKEWIRFLDLDKDENQGRYIDIFGNIGLEDYAIDYSVLYKEYENTENIDKQRLVLFTENNTIKGEIDIVIKEPTCPRYVVGMKSGEGLSCCSCRHSESNAIFASSGRTEGSSLYCFCGVPCADCTGDIIHAGIKTVYCLDDKPDYSYQSRSWLNQANIKLIEIPRGEIKIHD